MNPDEFHPITAGDKKLIYAKTTTGVDLEYVKKDNGDIAGHFRDSNRYILFDGESYVDTLIEVGGSRPKLEATFAQEGWVDGTKDTLMGVGPGISPGGRFSLGVVRHATNPRLRFAINSASSVAVSPPVRVNLYEKHTVSMGRDESGTIFLSDGEVIMADSTSTVIDSGGNTAWIGCIYNSSSPTTYLSYAFVGRVYNYILWKDGELVFDGYPVYKDEVIEGKIAPSDCFYDFISKTFFENQGTGTLTFERDNQNKIEGNPIEVDGELKELTLVGETIQAGTGAPSPTNVRPIISADSKIFTGGNIFLPAGMSPVTSNGITFAPSLDESGDMVITMNGTHSGSNATYTMAKRVLTPLPPATTFYCNKQIISGTASSYSDILVTLDLSRTPPEVSGGWVRSLYLGAFSAPQSTATLGAGRLNEVIAFVPYVYLRSGVVVDNLIVKIALGFNPSVEPKDTPVNLLRGVPALYGQEGVEDSWNAKNGVISRKLTRVHIDSSTLGMDYPAEGGRVNLVLASAGFPMAKSYNYVSYFQPVLNFCDKLIHGTVKTSPPRYAFIKGSLTSDFTTRLSFYGTFTSLVEFKDYLDSIGGIDVVYEIATPIIQYVDPMSLKDIGSNYLIGSGGIKAYVKEEE